MTILADTPSAAVILEFIGYINARNAGKARSLMTDEAELIFPGGAKFTDVEAFLEWTKTRYRSANFSYDRIDEAGDNIVYALGEISGELNDGATFSGVRSIDRFLLKNGKIVRKEAWSDMADFLRKRNM